MKNISNYFAIRILPVFLLLNLITFSQSISRVFQVGGGRQYSVPSMVIDLVNDGDTIDIDAGLYKGDVCSWNKNNLLFRGIGGLAHLNADGKSAEQKAIWVIKGQNCTVEYIEFSDCKVPDNNGAGIRAEGDNLYVRHCYFHDNEDGLLSGASKSSTIIIEFSEFAGNGHGDGYSHNMYIGAIKKFILRFCYIHNAIVGHNVKSRASENFIAYNLIIDSTLGNASYQIDLPNGGLSHIIGNSIMKGKNAENSCLISYGMEGIQSANSTNLFIYNNTLINERSSAKVLQFNDSKVFPKLINNMFVNIQNLCDKPCDTLSNIFIDKIEDCHFKDNNSYNYQLTDTSPGIDKGVDIAANIPDLYYIPLEFQYKHPIDSISRITNNVIDIGAFEYKPATAVTPNNNSISFECTIYPNPVTQQSKVVIQAKSSPITIEITDINGKTISDFGTCKIETDTSHEIEFLLYDRFNINELSKGIYFLRVKSGNIVKSVMFVI